jgi:signal transduction histidine kinase
MTLAPSTVEVLQHDNDKLLLELEVAYQTMELLLESANREKEIAYRELQNKFSSLEKLYGELSKKENLLIHLEKLSSIGQFISEIMHELNHPLTIISSHAEMAMMLNNIDDIKKHLEALSNQTIRMAGHIHKFGSMAYKGKENFTIFDINNNLRESLLIIDIIKPKHVKVNVQLAVHPLKVCGDAYQINQVFINLAKNAFDALKSGGNELKVTSHLVTSAWIRSSPDIASVYCQQKTEWENSLQANENFIFIEFADNGIGIPDEEQAKIFEPFYTSKERGQGTGLGLSISSDIIKRHRGNISVKSKLQHGATFQVFMPQTLEQINLNDQIG